MDGKISKRNINFIIAVIILCALIFLFGNRNFRTVVILSERMEKLREEIKELKESNACLEEELRQMKENPEYFEDLARKRLGLIKPGETKYKLVSPEEER